MRTLAFLMLTLFLLGSCRGAGIPQPTPIPSGPPPTPSAALLHTPQAAEDDRTQEREQMVLVTIEGRGIQDPNVLKAMRNVVRHEFVPVEVRHRAYADRPLPIGYGQTISQPYIVAWMTELLDLEPGERVLEIGTGSGYQAAVLAELPGVQIYTIEIVPPLAEEASARLKRLGYTGIQAKQGDGYYGWPEHAPFDAIIVTAAPDHLPQPLVEQLADQGRLVIPIGPPGSYQSLWQFTRTGEELQARNLGGVGFVPFTGPGIEGAEPEPPDSSRPPAFAPP